MKKRIKVVSGITPPESSRGRPIIYPFQKMKIGDSFIWKCSKDEKVTQRRISICTTAKNRGYEIKTIIQGTKIKVWLVGKI